MASTTFSLYISLSLSLQNCMVTQWRHAPVETSWLFAGQSCVVITVSNYSTPQNQPGNLQSDWPKPGPRTIFMASHAKASQYFLTSGSAALDDDQTCGDLDEAAWRGSVELPSICTPHEQMSSHCLHFTNSYILYLRNSTTRIFIGSRETWKNCALCLVPSWLQGQNGRKVLQRQEFQDGLQTMWDLSDCGCHPLKFGSVRPTPHEDAVCKESISVVHSQQMKSKYMSHISMTFNDSGGAKQIECSLARSFVQR